MKLVQAKLVVLFLLLIFHNLKVKSVDLEFKLNQDEFDIETGRDLLQPEWISTRSANANTNSSFDKCGAGIKCRNYEVCNMQTGLCGCAKDGFAEVSGTCEDLGECATGQHTCDGSNQECLNNFGSFVCICKKGFTFVPSVGCMDVDECVIGTFTCPANTICINVIGSFRCACRPGYQFHNGCVKDPCDPSPCQNNCTCLPDLATNTFTCDNTRSAYAGDNCTTRRPMYDCSAGNITITIPFDFLQHSFAPSKLALNENANISYKTFIGENRKSECELVENVETWGRVYSLDMNLSSFSCDTNVEVQKDTSGRTVRMMYNSTVWWVRQFTSLPGVSMPYQILSVVCDVDLTGNMVDFNFNSKIAEDKPLRTEDGTPNLQMTFWKVPPTATYGGIPLERPFQYVINENLHVLVEIKSTGNVYKNYKVYLDHCYLADREEKQSEFAVVANGCAAEASPFNKVVLVNGASSYAHFYFTLINFPIPAHQVYVKCDVKLCKNKCVPNCKRMKRHTDDTDVDIPTNNNYKTENGPIDLTKKNETKDTNDNETFSWFVRSYAEIAILCICNIAFLCFIGFMFYLLGKHVARKRRLLLSAAMCIDPPPSISPISLPRCGAKTTPHASSLLLDPKQKGRMHESKKISSRYARTPYNSPFPS